MIPFALSACASRWPEQFKNDPQVAKVLPLCEEKVRALQKTYGTPICMEVPYSVFEDLVKPPKGFQKGCVAEVVFNDPQEMVDQELLVINGMAKNVK